MSGRYVGRIDQDPSISAAVVSDGFSVLAYFTNGNNIDLATKVDARTDDVAPPTPNSPLRFVISASGDSLASGEGAPDVNGKYDGPDLAACFEDVTAMRARRRPHLPSNSSSDDFELSRFFESRLQTLS